MATQQLTIREATQQALTQVRSEEFTSKLSTLLGREVPVAKFQQVVALALQVNKDLLSADRSSLLLACMQAAKSKLLPDGKQGALVKYGSAVQWQVMIAGLRTLLARQGFDLQTEVVCEHDEFDVEMGDNPRITHRRPRLGQPRGEMIGVYAIARGPDGRLYRRVMDKAEVDYVRSKAKAGNVWKDWYNAMAEKTVGRALVKQLPIYDESEELREAIAADNDTFDLGTAPTREPSRAAQAAAAAARGEPAPQPANEDVIDVAHTEVTDAGDSGGADEVEDPLGGAGAPDGDIPF